jgi:multiple sugar transport system substrate-binding protein
MRSFSRRLPLFLVALVFFVSSTGCEQLINEFPFLQGSQPTIAPTATSAPVETPVAQTTRTVTTPEINLDQITLWLPPEFDPENGTPAGALLKAQLEIFKAEHEEYTLDVRIKATTGTGGMLDTLTTASLAAPGVVPGVLIMPRSEFEKAAENGLLMPVDAPEPADEQPLYFEYANDMSVVRDIQYGIPFAGDVLCMAYKPVEVAYPHTRWSELVQSNVKVTAFPAADPRALLETLLYMSRGGGFGTDEAVVTLDESALQQSLLILSNGATANAFPTWLTDFTDFDQAWQALLRSNATYAIIWASQYLTDARENITISHLPTWDDTNYTVADGWVLAFPQTSAEQLAGYQLLADYLLDTDFQASWTEAIGLLPVTEEALNRWNDPEVSAILLDISRSAHPMPSNLIMSEISPLFNQATVEMIRKQTTYIESSNKILKALAE